MVHPAVAAISFGLALGGAIFALFYMNSQRNQNNQRTHTYEERTRVDPIDLIQSQLEADMCSICLERFNNDDVFLECMHRFHRRCINESVRHSKLCPICRQPVKVLRS